MRTRIQKCGNKNIVGNALMLLRKDRNMTQKFVVNALPNFGIENIDNSSLSKIEGGHRQVTDKELLAFSKLFNASINEIFEMSKWRWM